MSIDKHTQDNTKTIIVIGFMAICSLMLLVSWVSMNTLQSVNQDMTVLIHNLENKTIRAYKMRDVIRLRTSTARALRQTQETTEEQNTLATLFNYTDTYRAARNELNGMVVDERETNILEQIKAVDETIDDAYDSVDNLLSVISTEVTATVESPDSETAETIANLVSEAPELRSQLHSTLRLISQHERTLLGHLNELVNLERQMADEALVNNKTQYRQTRKLLVILLGVSIALSLVISFIVAARVAKANRRIAHLANHDDLTGLHNRRSFEQHLQQTIVMASRSEMSYGLLYLDLDRFKIVNDTCGHHAGDQLLIQLTQMISERLRRGDLFARVGGDEFAIIAQAASFNDIRVLAEQLRVLVSDFTFVYDDHRFNVSLSIGVTPIDGQIVDMEQVLADVDSACYVAKESGRNRVHVTQDDDMEVVKYRSNLAGIQAIRKALAEERLSLYFQPVFEIRESSIAIAHCEILLRIRSENGELYSPARFIPIAEKYNIMTDIDRWVFKYVADWLAEHQSEYTIPRLLINLSGLSFADEEFSDFIVERLERGDIDAGNLAFEISEGAAVRNFQKASQFINKVRNLGCELALDDFGSGFSNFAYLKQLSFDYLKIDGSLVRNITNNDIDRKMVEAINQIGHTVGAKTIAEFVEDDASLECLRKMSVNFAQGYGLRMPAPFEQLVAELEPSQASAKASSADASNTTAGSYQSIPEDKTQANKDSDSDNDSSVRKAS